MFQDSSIILRIATFLKVLYPFRYFSEKDLNELSSYCEVAVFKKGQIIFKQNDLPSDHFYIVKKGAINIYDSTSDQQQIMIDLCGEGDMFGIRPILAESPYLYNAMASEDVILYQIPISLFKNTYHTYPNAVDYMIQRFAAGRSIRDDHSVDNTSAISHIGAIPVRPIQLSRKLISAKPDDSIITSIQIMDKHGVSSVVVVDENHFPVGIVTDRDIRKSIAQAYDFKNPITDIMSSPVQCIAQNAYIEEVQLVMIEKGVHHLCVTQDGTNLSMALGMITEHDILYSNSSDPIVIIKKIKKAEDIHQLKSIRSKIDLLIPIFLDDQLNGEVSLKMIDMMNRLTIQKTVDLSLNIYNQNATQSINKNEFCFFTMGSAARGEQVVMTDQDNGIIVSDDSTSPIECFLELGKIITTNLNELGYAYCPANMMASDERWCMKLSVFKNKAETWILNPGPDEILNTTIFFDYRMEYGNQMLDTELRQYIRELLNKQDIYIRFLAKQAISNPPPLSFFRKMIIEKNGQHKDQFDIKLRAMSPMSDIARTLTMDECFIKTSSTIERYTFLKTQDIGNAILYEDAIKFYIFLLKIKIKSAIDQNDNGRYINPSKLDKLDKIKLRRGFAVIRKLQDLVENKYKLGYL